MVFVLILLLVALASAFEAISDDWRERFQLYLEGNNDPREWGQGRYWGYFPFNNKSFLPRDGWHLLKYFIFGAYIVSIVLAEAYLFISDINGFAFIALMVLVRAIVFNLTLSIRRKKRK